MYPGEELLPPDLDSRLVELYRAWDALERARHRNEIIDFDLAVPRSVPPAASRQEVLDSLDRILADLKTRGHAKSLTAARVQASIAYLRGVQGDALPFGQYIETTLGIKPKRFDEHQIAGRREHVSDLIQQLPHGKSEPPLLFREEDLHRFQAALFVRDKRMMKRYFDFYREKWVGLLTDRLDAPLVDYDVSFEVVEEDAYWKNWISGNLSSHQIRLRVNYHPRHTWYHGSIETLVLHEYCGHAIQMISWHRRIERGELPQFFGILTVHFPDQFLLEGVAESMSHVLPNGTKLEAKSLILRDLHEYSLMVMNNVHIIANEEGPTAARDYAVEHLPFTRSGTIDAEIRDRTSHPLFRGYQYVYGIAMYTVRHAMDKLSPENKWRLLRKAYDSPMTAREFEEAQEMIADQA